MNDRLRSRTIPEQRGMLTMERSFDVPAAVARLVDTGDVIVANSVRRLDLERLVQLARRRSNPVVWYIREPSSLVFAAALGREVDVLVANSRPLAAEAARLAERDCTFVPSVIAREGLIEPEVRSVLLLVNASQDFGLDEALALAQQLPERKVVLQESWPLAVDERAALEARTAHLPNVEFRRNVPRSKLFRDAWAILAPYSARAAGLSRPRVMLEAQLLGIPMLAYDLPGLASIAASPELLVPVGAGLLGWQKAIEMLDDDYEGFRVRAMEFADTEIGEPHNLWTSFVEACSPTLDELTEVTS